MESWQEYVIGAVVLAVVLYFGWFLFSANNIAIFNSVKTQSLIQSPLFFNFTVQNNNPTSYSPDENATVSFSGSSSTANCSVSTWNKGWVPCSYSTLDMGTIPPNGRVNQPVEIVSNSSFSVTIIVYEHLFGMNWLPNKNSISCILVTKNSSSIKNSFRCS